MQHTWGRCQESNMGDVLPCWVSSKRVCCLICGRGLWELCHLIFDKINLILSRESWGGEWRCAALRDLIMSPKASQQQKKEYVCMGRQLGNKCQTWKIRHLIWCSFVVEVNFLGEGGGVKQDYIKMYELIAVKGFEELGGGNGINPLDVWGWQSGKNFVRVDCVFFWEIDRFYYLDFCFPIQISTGAFWHFDLNLNPIPLLVWNVQNCSTMVTVKSNLRWDPSVRVSFFSSSLLRCAKINSSTRTLRCLEMLPSKISIYKKKIPKLILLQSKRTFGISETQRSVFPPAVFQQYLGLFVPASERPLAKNQPPQANRGSTQ